MSTDVNMDDMNFDDLVLPGFPEDAGQEPLANPDAVHIKSRKDQPVHHAVPPGSVPINNGAAQHGEFGYVQRHVRKTSIDDRKACAPRRL